MRKTILTVVAAGALACGLIGAKAHAFAAADAPLQPGVTAPGFSLPSQTDAVVSLKDFKGKFVVLYFYPKDMTSGCTKEAHNFERDKDKYAAANAVVLGRELRYGGEPQDFLHEGLAELPPAGRSGWEGDLGVRRSCECARRYEVSRTATRS